MSEPPRERVTELLERGRTGSDGADDAQELFGALYGELHRIARAVMAGERAGHTLQPTALVHEAFLRLADRTRVSWQGRTHFLAVGARVMRRVLIDEARRRSRRKRGGGWRRVTLVDWVAASDENGLGFDDLLALDRALAELSSLDEREARVVEMRFFGGLTVSEIAAELDVSKRTVEADWTHARAWLARELARG